MNLANVLSAEHSSLLGIFTVKLHSNGFRARFRAFGSSTCMSVCPFLGTIRPGFPNYFAEVTSLADVNIFAASRV